MDDNQIAELFIDYWDTYRPEESDSDESHARYILDLCALISLRAYANREVDENDFSEKAVTLLNDGPSMTAAKILGMGWNSLADALSINPNLHYKSFNEVLLWKRPVFASLSEFSKEVSSKEPKEAFDLARYADYSNDVIESLAKSFYKEFVGMDSRGLRFAFYGAIFSLSPQQSFDTVNLASHFERNLKEANQTQITWLKNEFLRQEGAQFISFIVDQVDPEGLQLNIMNEAQENHIQRPIEMKFSDPLLELRGIADFHPNHTPYSHDLVDYDVDAELSEDFVILGESGVVDFLDYYAYYQDQDYPKALYLMVANPFVTLEFDLPELNTKTFDSEWEFYGTYNDEICNALPGDFHGIFHTVPRVLSFYSLQAVVERTEDLCQFAWDPYRSILFTRTDLSEAQRTEYLTERLQNITANDIDESSPVDETGAYDIEIACLFEMNEKMHQQIFDVGSTLLNLALLLNPSISKSLREEIGNTGLEIEFPEDFDSPKNITLATGLGTLIDRAETYKDPGLAQILRGLNLHTDHVDATEEFHEEMSSDSGSSLKKLVRRSFEHDRLNLVSAAEDAVTHLKDLFEFDEDQFVEVVEEVIDDGISKDFGYEISRSILNFADTDSVFVGTYFTVLSGADLIDPSVMQAVAEIKVYPFYADIDEFNRSKCPAASVALSPSVTEELLEVLAKSNEIDIKYRVVLNSNTNEQTLLHIVQNSIKYQGSPEFEFEFILGTIALHRNSTAKVIQALESSPFASTSQAISLRMKATKPLCKVVNSDCAQLSPKSVFGRSLLWWDITGMSWAIPGISCSQGVNCRLGIGDNSK